MKRELEESRQILEKKKNEILKIQNDHKKAAAVKNKDPEDMTPFAF